MEYHIEEKTQNYWEKKDVKKIISIIIQVMLGFPKTVWFNLFYFGFRGLKLPVVLSPKVKLSKLKGKVFIEADYRFGMIKLGFPATETFDNRKLSFIWVNDGIVAFKGCASMHNGTSIRNYGVLEFGERFHTPATATIICYKHIRFGNDVLIGWNFEATDGDAHKIYALQKPNIRTNQNREIVVGNQVWFGSDVRIYKGVSISDNTVVAAGTKLFKNTVKTENCVIGDNPVRILKDGITWRI
ncbi:hypothetical protein ACTQ3O_07690 [Mediterraneibacter faecis]|uniref:hypothetical protein n=1 Tax=Mediterraneibacter faecis TaxID=592978 RepID=UPI003F9AA4EB